MPIELPQGVSARVDGRTVTVTGNGVTLSETLNAVIGVKTEDGRIIVTRKAETKEARSLHGLSRSLIYNMVEGVSRGYRKELEINGVGFRAVKQGTDLVMNLGFSHQVTVPEPAGITIEVPAPNRIVVRGADKQAVGQLAAEIRAKRPPEPYKGKGIRYAGEHIIRKEGKAGKAK